MLDFSGYQAVGFNRRGRHVKAPAESSAYQLVGKRAFDLLIAILVIVLVLTWLIPLLGALIRLTSRGPVFFVQLRTGRNGQHFRCLKLRTMVHGCSDGFQQTTLNDPRVTKVGRFLRRSNLDELPQVLNVLMGEMSIVGPRPHAIQHDAQYWNTLPGYRDRYLVKPGITGLAQVRGCRGETTRLQQMRHRVRLDHWYIEKVTLGLDLKICWWTVRNMLTGDKDAW